MKILLMETPSSFGYAIISKYGKMGIYNGDLKLLMKYDIIFIRNDELKIGKPRHRRSTWITDGIFIPNICLIVISTSARTLICYDASSLMHKPLWLIEGIGDTIQVILYAYYTFLFLLNPYIIYSLCHIVLNRSLIYYLAAKRVHL